MSATRGRSTRSPYAVGLIVTAVAVASANGTQQTQSTPPAPNEAPALVFESVNVIDVSDGRVLSEQTVVVVGNRIQAMGPARGVQVPAGAQIVDGRTKYLIPGMWDMHTHVDHYRPGPQSLYNLLIANGTTGIRDAGSKISLDTLRQWRQEVAAGTRVGPRQIFAGPSLAGRRNNPRTTAEARFVVDSLKAAGADFIKMRGRTPDIYFAVVSRARELNLGVGGHVPAADMLIAASDSGVTYMDHNQAFRMCFGKSEANAEECTPIAERFRRNSTWFVPTLVRTYNVRYHTPDLSVLIKSGGMPMLTGTDAPGIPIQNELVMLVEQGLKPLEALQAATVNPAKAIRGTDSLGTIAPGKLADLVLLDADPLADIQNTKKVRGVVANGRYFDRAALDTLQATGGKQAAQLQPAQEP